MSTYFGFAIADSMFSTVKTISREVLTADEVKALIASDDVISCLNPSHVATISAMQQRYGFDVAIPETPTPPRVDVKVGDAVLVMGVRGLPRLTDRHEYTQSEIDEADFSFSIYRAVE